MNKSTLAVYTAAVLAPLFGCIMLIALGACGYRMQAADYSTLQNMAPNCAINATMLAEAGPAFAEERANDKVCVCGARGILARSGQSLSDAGRLGCPQ